MSVTAQVRALRSSVGIHRPTHVAAVKIEGPGALELLQAACAQSPHLRMGRVRSTLLLRSDASVFADVLVVNAGDGFVLLAEGPDEASLSSWLSSVQERGPTEGTKLCGLGSTHALIGVDGPYAWELVSGLLGPAVLGLPYSSLLRRAETICIRGGKTGEYGYLLVVPLESESATMATLFERGSALDATEVSLDALDTCALESGHFTMRQVARAEIASTLTPIELQLQWRVSYDRAYIGADALRARKAEGAKARVTCFVSSHSISAGQRVSIGDREVGEVLASCASPTLGVTVGSALLEHPFAHPHLDLHAHTDEGPRSLQTCSAFLVDNLSRRVSPHLGHTYATRGART